MKNIYIVFIIFCNLLLFSCSIKQNKLTTNLFEKQPETIIVNISSASDENLKLGQANFEGRCTSCHQLYEPNEFDKNEWKSITYRMQKKAHLNDVEINQVYEYIVSNLK